MPFIETDLVKFIVLTKLEDNISWTIFPHEIDGNWLGSQIKIIFISLEIDFSKSANNLTPIIEDSSNIKKLPHSIFFVKNI